MKLTHLYRVQNNQITELKFVDVSIQQIKQDHSLNINTNYYLTVEQDTNVETIAITVDLSLLLLETIIGTKTSWQDIVNTFTPAMVDSYKSNFFDTKVPSRFVEQISCMNHPTLNIQYTSLSSPNDRNNKSQIWKYKDIVISQTQSNKVRPINFNNCLCSINGLVSKPIIFNNELFIPDGLTYMLDTRAMKHPDIVLLNFDNLANIQLVPFSECKEKILHPKGSLTDWCDIEVILPSQYSLANKTLMAVIGNTLILPEKLDVISANAVHLNPYIYPLKTNIVKYLQLSEKYIRNTDIYRSNEMTIKYYLEKILFSNNHYGAFFIIIDNPNLYKYDMCVSPEVDPKMLRTKGSYGILRHKKSWGIVDYVIDKYNNINVLNLNESRHLYILEGDYLGEQFGTDSFSCVHYKDELQNLRYSDFEYFKLIA